MNPPTHTTRIAQFLYLVIGVGVIGGIVYLTMRSQPVVIAPDTTDNTTVIPVSWASAEIDKVVVEDSGKYYAINATYPVAANSAVTTYFKTFVDTQVALFKSESVPTSLPEDTAVQVYTLDITYTNERGLRADNYIFITAIDTGGAHGLQSIQTFTFTKEGALVEVKDLFTTAESGLTIIAPYVQAQLSQNEFTMPEWVSTGAAPTTDNYQNFVVTDTGIQFIFDPYQVAAYAAGTLKVDVPLSVFRSIANKDLFE